jgi:hypothetical protein
MTLYEELLALQDTSASLEAHIASLNPETLYSMLITILDTYKHPEANALRYIAGDLSVREMNHAGLVNYLSHFPSEYDEV